MEGLVMTAGYVDTSGSVAAHTIASAIDPVDFLRHPAPLTSEEKTAAIARVRWLERDLFQDGQVRRRISRDTAEAVVAELNQLRASLGWLEVDLEGRWRWPH
jgi:hypothetical protein